jgi:hypothetical protein
MCDCSKCENYKEKGKSAFEEWRSSLDRTFWDVEKLIDISKTSWNAAIDAVLPYVYGTPKWEMLNKLKEH